MGDQLVLGLLDLIELFSEEALTTSSSEVLELLLLILAVLFFEIFHHLRKVLMDDTTVNPSSHSPVISCEATMMEAS